MSEDRHDISICKDKAFLGGPCADLLCVHRDELLNETLFFNLDHARLKSLVGSRTSIPRDRTLRCDVSHRLSSRPISPLHTIGCATPTSSADHLLLNPAPHGAKLI
jgi:hypothetical protein